MATTGAKTVEFERILLNYLFDGAGSAPDNLLYIGLVSGNPDVDDVSASAWHSTHEVAAGRGYARQSVQAGQMNAASTNAVAPFATTIDNATEINFGTSTAAGWGTVTGFFIANTDVEGATGTYYYGIFDTPKSVEDGDSVRIIAGNLTIEER